MKAITTTFDPVGWIKSWGLALKNNMTGLAETMKNRRLWIGIGASLAVHAVIIFLSVAQVGKPVGTDQIDDWIVLKPDDSYRPDIADRLNQGGGSIVEPENKTVTNPLVDKPDLFQPTSNIEKDAAELAGYNPHGTIVTNPDYQLTTEKILSGEPTESWRTIGGLTKPLIPDIENPISWTEIANTRIGEPLSGNNNNNVVAPAVPDEVTTSTASGSGYTLEGDLSKDDVLASVMPIYPDFAVRRGLSDVYVTIQFSVGSRGQVNPALVVTRSSGYPQWDWQVKEAVKAWRFKTSQVPRRNARITFHFVLT